MNEADLATLVRANLDLPIFQGITDKLASQLPSKGYCVIPIPEQPQMAHNMAQALIESYCVRHFKTLGAIYRYVSETGNKLAMDVWENLKPVDYYIPQKQRGRN